jgi:ectoine hydroxylase-related dioxygenase (phytanoyl-CoA dioxygenase family)
MRLSLNGIELRCDPDRYGELRDAHHLLDDLHALKARMEEDGYLLLRGFLDRETVLNARKEILSKYASVGEIDAIHHPLMDAVYSEESSIDRIDLAAFAESIRSGAAYENVVMNPKLVAFFERWFGRGAVRTFDFKWPRFFRPGEGTGLHCDSPYVNRGTSNLYSAWIPLGDVDRENGALLVLENSHKSERLKETYCARDSDRDALDWLDTDPHRLQDELGGRWLTSDFKAGDVFLFSINLVHGGLDNNSPTKRCRLTSDTRYQPADEPLDDRWNGFRRRADNAQGARAADVAAARRELGRLILRPPK